MNMHISPWQHWWRLGNPSNQPYPTNTPQLKAANGTLLGTPNWSQWWLEDCGRIPKKGSIHPWKLYNMEPKNHPTEKENHLPSTYIFGFNMLNFRSVNEMFREIPLDMIWYDTLSPIIMEVENYPKWKETNIGGIHFPLPWLWEEG